MESKVVDKTILTGPLTAPCVRTFKSVNVMLRCGRSNESYCTMLSCGTVCYAVQGGSKALAKQSRKQKTRDNLRLRWADLRGLAMLWFLFDRA